MKKFVTAAGAAALLAGAMFASSASATITQFAEIHAVGTSNVKWVKSRSPGTGGSLISIATPTSTSQGAVPVAFSFDNEPFLSALTDLPATLNLDITAASGNPALNAGGFLIQGTTSGSFQIIYTGAPIVIDPMVTISNGSNLLSGTITTGGLAGTKGGTSAGFDASTAGGSTIVYTSDVLSFVGTQGEDVAFNLTSIINKVGNTNKGLQALTGKSLTNFVGTAGGSFSSDPAPSVIGTPEPSAWALMLLGVGGIGAFARRRKAAVAA